MLKIIKNVLAILGILLVSFEIYFHCYEKQRVEELVNDAKLFTLFLMSDNFDPNDMPNAEDDLEYGEVS